MSLRIRQRNVTPPGGYFGIDPDHAEFRAEGGSIEEVVEKIQKHRKDRGMTPIKDLAAIIEDAICRKAPGNICIDDKGNPVAGPRHVSTAGAINATAAAVKLSGQLNIRPTNAIEANRRASICVACPKNVDIGCKNCSGIDSILKGMRGMKGADGKPSMPETQYEARLMGCQMTGLLNPIQVYLGEAVLVKRATNRASIPESCWMRGFKMEVTRDAGHHVDIRREGGSGVRPGHAANRQNRQIRKAMAVGHNWPRVRSSGCRGCGHSR